VYPTGATGGSSTSSINAAQGATVPNLVTAKTDGTGHITIFNSVGTVDVVVDIEGYYSRDSADTYTPNPPLRVLDTRSGTGAPQAPVGPGQTITLQVAGAPGLPASGVDAVALNVTAVDATQGTYVSVYPTGFVNGPKTSSLNVPDANAVPNLVVSKVAGDGTVTLFNFAGSTDLVADLLGYYSTSSGLALEPVPPVRVLDTRPNASIGQDASLHFLVAASGERAGGVVANLTGILPSATTYLNLYPDGTPVAQAKGSAILNVLRGAVRANADLAAVTANPVLEENIYNRWGVVDVAADLSGYFSSEPVKLPQTSVTLTTAGGLKAHVSGGSPGDTVTFVDVTGVFGVLASGTVGADGTATPSTSITPGTYLVTAVVDAQDGIEGSTSSPVSVTI
jgi:hypothetical protein